MPIWPLSGALGQGGGLGLAIPDKQRVLAQILDPACLCGVRQTAASPQPNVLSQVLSKQQPLPQLKRIYAKKVLVR